ncbi:MAG: 3-hydroxyacyl-CoA dehydrogenase NAD-binding domain-containing protein [Actinomycetota bacterium]|nr:3-hydroxyacyl-CoA dehydrogenase NAD-binding domain-containing protein [Actinomycetota bacterium]
MTATAAPPALAGEVVTRALLRFLELPGGPGRLALITLDNGADHTKPNTLGPAGLRALGEALDAAAASDAVAVAVTGKPFGFAAGADLTGVPQLRTREQAREIARLGHATFRRLAELGKPTFAYVNGLALGGGLELALHCTYRTISAGVPALGLPEVFLGLVPGWGGAYLLPRLVGPERAVTVIVENTLENNRTLTGPQAFALGLADALFEPADFLECSLAWTAAVLRGDLVVKRPPAATEPADAWEAAAARGRAIADAKVHGAAPAAYRALDLVVAGRTRGVDEAYAAEDEALADLLLSDELRSGLYAFDLVQRRAKRPAGAPDRSLARPVTKVGVVGAGLMASQLALLFVRRLQVPVVLTDLDAERVQRGVGYVHTEIDRLLGKRRVSADAANRLKALVSGAVDKASFGDADLVIEAVFEEMTVKQRVLAEVEAAVSPGCVLATNTSSLSVREMAAGLRHPERVVGMHFFNPVAVMPLLEVVGTDATDDAALATAFAVGRELKKSCVRVGDAPAFVVNRVLTRLLSEVLRAVDEGTPVPVADRALAPLGLPMSPIALLQLVGLPVALHVAETLHAAFPERFYVSENLRWLVADGRTGLFAADERGRPQPDPAAFALLRQGDSVLTEDEVRGRALDALAQEARLLLDEGVVAAAQDLDLCMILGAGWPFHLGGLTPYLDRTGTSERVTGRRFLPPGVASVA